MEDEERVVKETPLKSETLTLFIATTGKEALSNSSA